MSFTKSFTADEITDLISEAVMTGVTIGATTPKLAAMLAPMACLKIMEKAIGTEAMTQINDEAREKHIAEYGQESADNFEAQGLGEIIANALGGKIKG